MDQSERKNWMGAQFHERFGSNPEILGRAPGRVDLMGSHTDYNLGYVMTTAIDLDTWIAARPRADRVVRLYSLNTASGVEFSLDDIRPRSNWSDYVHGVAWALQDDGLQLAGFDGLVHSTVPFGCGLASSAALEMASAVIFQKTSDLHLDPVRLALTCQKAENLFVGMNSGILDPYISALGQPGSALLVDCRDLTHQVVSLAEDIRVVICDSRQERRLDSANFGERRSQCEEGARILSRFYTGVRTLRDATLEMLDEQASQLPEVVQKRCQFIIEENQRTLDLAVPLSAGDWALLASLFEASYLGARNLYEIITPGMEAMRQSMLNMPGITVARQTGVGFGGSLVGLVPVGLLERFVRHIEQDFFQRSGFHPQVFSIRPAPGAGLVPI